MTLSFDVVRRSVRTFDLSSASIHRRSRGIPMSIQSTFETVRAADEARPDIPGEHWVVLGAGVLLLLAAGRGRSVVGRMVAGALGSALIGRAASGRGGLASLARVLATARR
jgi:hypothetical protein